MKPSTIKKLKQLTYKEKKEKYGIYRTQLMNYNKADSYYIEVFTNVKRVIKVEAITEEEAIEKALKREERRKTRNCYIFVDCDYNMVEEKDYEAYRQINPKV
jgi:hypothetical protein|tara:strand:+ start:43 stop:348 length:306 start_codon:yes stop_codon:yes gene_type:complete